MWTSVVKSSALVGALSGAAALPGAGCTSCAPPGPCLPWARTGSSSGLAWWPRDGCRSVGPSQAAPSASDSDASGFSVWYGGGLLGCVGALGVFMGCDHAGLGFVGLGWSWPGVRAMVGFPSPTRHNHLGLRETVTVWARGLSQEMTQKRKAHVYSVHHGPGDRAVLAFVLDRDLVRGWRAVLGRVLDRKLRRWRWAVLAFVRDRDLL